MPKKELKGIGGWLLVIFIIFCLTTANHFFGIIGFILKPLIYSFFGNLSEYEPSAVVQAVSFMFTLALFVTALMTVIYIAKKKKAAKNFAIAALWIGFAFTLFTTAYTIADMPKIIELQDIPNEFGSFAEIIVYIMVIGSLIFSLAWAIIWTLYFKKSERVKSTLVEK